MTFVFSAAGIRALDAELDALDLLEPTMETAGARVASEVNARFERSSVLVLAGSGAKGGDAFVAARHLHALGWRVEVLALETKHALAKRMRARLEPFVAVRALTVEALTSGPPTCGLVLDGLLGTGFAPPLRAPLPELVNALRGRRIVSIDLPSGLRSDTVEDDLRVEPDLTLALTGFKPALLFHDLREVAVVDLGIPRALLERHALARVTDRAEVRALLPKRPKGAHKGTAGRVWILGGSPGYVGAPALTSLGALRAGAGLVSVFSRADIPGHPLEVMAHRVAGFDKLPSERPNAVAVGMGLREDGPDVARRVLSWNVPSVLDADALQPDLHGHDAVVWTPHPGEAARMLECGAADITRDPFSAARALHERFGGVVVLKGAPTLVASRGDVVACPFGHPGMATGGMGDVLAGVIAALLGQGLSAREAALAGVNLHALAGEAAARGHGYGLTASDVAHELGPVWQNLTSGF